MKETKRRRKNILAMGTVAMDLVLESMALPSEDSFAMLLGERLMPGGSSANLLVALTQLGANAFQAGKIGDDEYGKAFRATLLADGVDDRYLVTNPGGSTLHTFIVTAPGGKHCIFSNLGDSVMNLEAEDLPRNIMDEIDFFYTDLFSARASLHLARLARDKGIPVFYNMQCSPSFMESCGVSIEEIKEMIGLATIFASGRDGYREMAGEQDYHKAIRVFYKQHPIPMGVICTAGEEGAVWLDKKEQISAKAFEVEAVDTTGAGDCFLAGLIWSYFCEGKGRQEAMNFASAAAAIKCTMRGPRTRVTLDEVNAFIHSAT